MRPLAEELRELIEDEGPLTVERYMAFCLQRYYGSRDPLGAGGDFTTAPEISQMFGELLGAWAAAAWQAIGNPRPIRLVELGPGRGTLMADAVRALRRVPGLVEALQVHLVETSVALRERQAATLSAAPVPLSWHEVIEEVPAGPAIFIANEFFDALPIRQFVRTERGWCERLVGLKGERFAFGVAWDHEPSVAREAPLGTIIEVAPAAAQVVEGLATRLVRDGGAALIVDYGYWGARASDTLQAVKAHAFADPLLQPGEADLTAHVDFQQLARAAALRGAVAHGPASQADFLRALGIEMRAAALKSRATPEQQQDIDAALERLTHANGMGELFKVLAIAHPSLHELPGLSRASFAAQSGE